ncbi:sialate O-acetylesterase [Flavitalea antarctica]
MNKFRTGYLLLFLLTLSICKTIRAQVKLPQLIRDSMVLQREARINIWGQASPGERITVKFNGKVSSTKTGDSGRWLVTFPPMKAGGPYTMQIDASNHIKLHDILIGDVYICSGQSNMVHQLELHKERYEKEIAEARYPQIRHFAIATKTDLRQPAEDLPSGNWKSANPADVLRFSAVAYFFAKTLYDKYKVPIGLINASVGGTPIEAWTSEDGLKNFPSILATIEKNKDTGYVNTMNRMAAERNASRPKSVDNGLAGPKRWFDTSYIPKGWHAINIPGFWEDQGISDLDGVVWYRREIDVPAGMTGIPAKMYLGRIVDADFLYINGQLVANTTYQYPQRRYALAPGVLKPGKNLVVIRVINNSGKGGFIPGKPYELKAGDQRLDLKGDWQYKVGEAFERGRNLPTQGLSAQNQPTALYNAMIAPLINYTIRGFLWYQGETNIENASAYQQLLPALIKNWREKWKQGDLPFLYVQLPNFMEAKYHPSESDWAVLRDAQLKTLVVPNTAMAVAIDLGEWNDIHPGNKKDVGVRLALAAQHLVYKDQNIVPSGPLYKSFVVEGNRIIVNFTHTGSGLKSIDGEELSQFAIAGRDKRFIWAKAKIEGDKVIVWNDTIVDPLYVRYAWADNPDGANLYNMEGLPGSPFRTDD